MEEKLCAVIADRFDWTAFHRLFAESFFLRILRLFVNVGMSAAVVPLEIGWRSLPTQIAVDALLIDVKFPGNVLRIFIRGVRHFCPDPGEENGTEKREPAQRHLLFAVIRDDLQAVAKRSLWNR